MSSMSDLYTQGMPSLGPVRVSKVMKVKCEMGKEIKANHSKLSLHSRCLLMRPERQVNIWFLAWEVEQIYRLSGTSIVN